MVFHRPESEGRREAEQESEPGDEGRGERSGPAAAAQGREAMRRPAPVLVPPLERPGRHDGQRGRVPGLHQHVLPPGHLLQRVRVRRH